jgi:hypothetical protein
MLANLTTTNKELTSQQITTHGFQNYKTRSPATLCAPGGNQPLRPGRDQTTRRFSNINYCWMHGYDISLTITPAKHMPLRPMSISAMPLVPTPRAAATKANTK